jgi:hypothetical protein
MSLLYIQCKPCTYLVSRLALSLNALNRAPPDSRHLVLPSGASKMIYEPMVRLTQTEHLSYTDANTVSKQIEKRFHMTHVTQEFRQVPPVQFLSLRYVRGKPCMNLASTVALSPNRPKQASTWASSPRSPIECVQNDFYAYVMFGTTHAPIFALTLTLSPNRLKRDFTRPTSLMSSNGCVQNNLWAYGTFSANHAPMLCQD